MLQTFRENRDLVLAQQQESVARGEYTKTRRFYELLLEYASVRDFLACDATLPVSMLTFLQKQTLCARFPATFPTTFSAKGRPRSFRAIGQDFGFGSDCARKHIKLALWRVQQWCWAQESLSQETP